MYNIAWVLYIAMGKNGSLRLLALLCILSSAWSGYPIPDEQLLFENLMRHYQKSVRPVINASDVLTVNFSLSLNHIVGLDERQQVLTTTVFINQKWTDENLAWRPEDYNQIRSLRVAGSSVWLPDTFIFNNADDGSTGFMGGTFVQIHSDGTVLWTVPVKLRSSCKVDITYFPFDDQKCNLTFGSWIYSGLWVDYENVLENESNDSVVDMWEYVNNSEWDLSNVTLIKKIRRSSCCNQPHPYLNFILHIRRKTFYYIFNIIVPCIMLSVLTLLTFWLPPTSGEKVTLGLNVFLAFSMFMLLVAEQVPATSEAVPLIGIYLCIVMTMTSVSVIMAVIVINVYNRGMKMRRAPAWIRTLTLNWLSKVLRVKHDIELVAKHVVLEDHYYEVTKRPDHASQIRKSYSKFDISKQPNSPIFTRHNNNAEGYQPVRNRIRNSIGEHSEPRKLEHDQNQGAWHRQESIRNGRTEPGTYSGAGSGEESIQSCNIVPTILVQSPNASQNPQLLKFPNQNTCPTQSTVYQNAPGCSSTQPVRYEEVVDADSDHDSVQQTPHIKKMVVAEWQRIAVVVDRFLFWFYFIVTFTAYLIILIIVPTQHHTQGQRRLDDEGGFQNTT